MKAFLLGVYLVFFAVQLHFRYAFFSFFPSTAHQPVLHQTVQVQQQQSPGHQQIQVAAPQVKLNKRYQPQSVFEGLPALEVPKETYTAVEQHRTVIVAPLHSTIILHVFQRGPPRNS
ncbi:hypothetical protein D3H65_20320 [Paraflavitalea soli]|uniref:Uncharacterized protein n=1 Tax=Paraflavitalea soli TaxID=2315862 RepID=A0A3B7MSC5_9BACT|nr:hypothetical protein D3H65_20320 [Paraflavitalea soli]